MLTFKTIKGKVIRAVAVAASLAAAAAGASVVKNEAMTEHAPAPHLRYAYINTGPIESRRAEYVLLRDQMDAMVLAAREAVQTQGDHRHMAQMLAELRTKASPAYQTLRAEFLSIPTEEKWVEAHENLVTTVGGNDLLTQYFKGSSYTAAWYLGLMDNASYTGEVIADTAASHAGWLESTVYSNPTRVALSFGTAGSKSLAASAASFTINTGGTVKGAFCISNSTKSGTTGILYSAGIFSGTRVVLAGDTLNVTLTVTC